MSLKHTQLYQQHKKQGAKLVDFAGYSMPVWYNNSKDEHLAVRNNVGIFDISHMGMVVFNGVDSFDFLQRVCTNDLNKTINNKIIYTMILNDQGGILDDVMVGFNSDIDRYFMIINASNKDKIMVWFEKNGLDLSTVDIRFDTHGLLAIQGPKSVEILTDIIDVDWDHLGRFESQLVTIDGIDCLVMRTGYTGEDGIEIACLNTHVEVIWNRCIDAGITPCGLAARDSLRIESGLPLYGHELYEDLTPLHTRYKWVLAWGTGFIGEDSLIAKKELITDITVGLKFKDRCLPRQGYLIEQGGLITSGTYSPILDCPIAMAIIPTDVFDNFSTIDVDIRGRLLKADFIQLPFLK